MSLRERGGCRIPEETLKIPEITEVARLEIRPGDRLIVRADTSMTPSQADYVKQRLREYLHLPDDFPIAVLDNRMDLQVVAGDA